MNKEYTSRLMKALEYITLKHPIYHWTSLIQGLIPIAYIILGIITWSLLLVLAGGLFFYIGHLLTKHVELPMIEKWMEERQ